MDSMSLAGIASLLNPSWTRLVSTGPFQNSGHRTVPLATAAVNPFVKNAENTMQTANTQARTRKGLKSWATKPHTDKRKQASKRACRGPQGRGSKYLTKLCVGSPATAADEISPVAPTVLARGAHGPPSGL